MTYMLYPKIHSGSGVTYIYFFPALIYKQGIAAMYHERGDTFFGIFLKYMYI